MAEEMSAIKELMATNADKSLLLEELIAQLWEEVREVRTVQQSSKSSKSSLRIVLALVRALVLVLVLVPVLVPVLVYTSTYWYQYVLVRFRGSTCNCNEFQY